ncbi:MAG TPA: hypothetical protein VMY16_13340 [Ilumatobacteraceae bacterium]|nr:hypothetical protein [Ilumatobacteraceae bacterium]
MGRRARVLITAAFVGVLVAPVVLNEDGFPLSTYPMYSRSRGAVVTFVTAQGIDANGETTALTLEVIGDSDDPLIVAGELRDAIRDGRAQQRCDEIAARAADWGRLPPRTAAIEVVTERHDVVAQVEGTPSVLARTVHAACEVQR